MNGWLFVDIEGHKSSPEDRVSRRDDHEGFGIFFCHQGFQMRNFGGCQCADQNRVILTGVHTGAFHGCHTAVHIGQYTVRHLFFFIGDHQGEQVADGVLYGGTRRAH